MVTEFEGYFADAFDDLNRLMGESLIYRPRSGGARNLNGIVNRDPPQVFISSELVQPTLMISVHHDSTSGIVYSEIDAGDKIDVAVKPGATPETRLITKVESSDGGVTVLVVR